MRGTSSLVEAEDEAQAKLAVRPERGPGVHFSSQVYNYRRRNQEAQTDSHLKFRQNVEFKIRWEAI